MVEGRCMKCKTDKKMKNAVITQTARGGYMAKGKCVDCGTTVCRMLSKENAEKAVKSGEAQKSF